MASNFIGLTIVITLKSPPNVLVQGLVANVIEETSTLILQDVYFPRDGRRMPTCSVDGAQIADIRLVESTPQPPPQQSQPPLPPIQTKPTNTAQSRSASAAATPTQSTHSFVDPAILSMGKRPAAQPRSSAQTATLATSILQEAPSTPLKMAAAAPPPTNTSPFVGVPKQPQAPSIKRDSSATLNAPFSGLNIADNADQVDDSDEPTVVDNGVRRVSITKTRTGKSMDAPVEAVPKGSKRGKRGQGGKRRQEQISQDFGVPDTSPEVVRKGANANGQFRGKGWRQTPILQEAASPSKTPGVIAGNVGQAAIRSSRKMQKHQRMLEAQNNGWATEDATDIQELPEFDFQSNLNKFDKRSVFEQIRNDDTTADEERLVSFNRLPNAARPGTYGGKNLHPTENVLDGPSPRIGARRGSQSDTSSSEFDFDSGRNSRRAMSRASNKRAPLRSNSNLAEEAGAHSSSHSAIPNRARGSVAGLGIPRSAYSSHSHSHGSPNIGSAARFTPPTSPSFDRGQQPLFPQQQAQFRLAGSGRVCPTITPGGMVAVEEIAEVEFGIPPEVLTENAGRGVAEVVLAAVNPGGRRLAKGNVALNAKPVCVVLVGNHKAGARAVAAARHLLGRGVSLVVCVLGYERGVELDRELKMQVDVLRKLGGAVKSWVEVRRWLQRGEVPVEAVLDALLPPGRTLDGLGTEDRAVVSEMVGWVNGSSGRVVVSVDAPSGVNGSTGEVSHEPSSSAPLAIRAKHIACIGAPRIGLLRALQKAHTGETGLDWSLWVIDIGVNKAWKQFGSPGGRGVRFDGEWVVPVTFVNGGAEG